MTRVHVAADGDLPGGETRTVEVGPHAIAVFRAAGELFAIDGRCPHREGPLGEGEVRGTIVTCPWHGWRFDLRTGANVNNPAVRVACFPVSIVDGEIVVDVP